MNKLHSNVKLFLSLVISSLTSLFLVLMHAAVVYCALLHDDLLRLTSKTCRQA